jgi:hypothetical protein
MREEAARMIRFTAEWSVKCGGVGEGRDGEHREGDE